MKIQTNIRVIMVVIAIVAGLLWLCKLLEDSPPLPTSGWFEARG
jgi:hypothetical protein